MNCRRRPVWIDLIIMLSILLILAILFSSGGCAFGVNDYVFNDRVDRPQNVKEKVYPIYNKKHLDVGEFLVVVGNEIEWMQKFYGWKIYKIRVEMERNLVRREEITIVWVYHD